MTLLYTRTFHLFSLSKVAPTKAKFCKTLCTSILIECFVDKVLPISIISDFLKVFGLALIFWWLTKVRADRKISRLVQMVTLENGPLWFMWSFCPSFITLSSRNDFHIISSVVLKLLCVSIFCKSKRRWTQNCCQICCCISLGTHSQSEIIFNKERNTKEKHGHGNMKWGMVIIAMFWPNVLITMCLFLAGWKTNTDVWWVYCRSSICIELLLAWSSFEAPADIAWLHWHSK